MQLRLIVLLVLICSSIAVKAQEEKTEYDDMRRFELVLGPSFSMNTGYLRDYKSKYGYELGIGYYLPVAKSFMINARLLYEQKGSTAVYKYTLYDVNKSVTPTREEITSRFNYFTLYVIPTFQLGPKKNILIGAGAYYSYLRKLNVRTDRTRSDNGDFISRSSFDQREFFDPTYDAGVTFQVGYKFNVNSKLRMSIQAFSNRGVKDLYSGSIGSQRNNTFGILLGFRAN